MNSLKYAKHLAIKTIIQGDSIKKLSIAVNSTNNALIQLSIELQKHKEKLALPDDLKLNEILKAPTNSNPADIDSLAIKSI